MELRELAERILFATTLEEKLQVTDRVTDEEPGPALLTAPLEPGRPGSLHFKTSGVEAAKFPGLQQLESPTERGRLLHFFCNHELLATELMALVLLRFPEAPAAFRRGVWQTLREEQLHTRWYLERMRACGQEFGALPVSGYFWRAVSGMRSPLDFVAGLSLTFEQANLDFARFYSRALATVGDNESAQLLDKIYHDEISHVAHGLKWFRRWKDPRLDDWTAYCSQLEFPLSPARAKGPQLNTEGRRAAGLEASFIVQLDLHAQSKGRTPNVYWFNPLAEGYLAQGSGFTPSKTQTALVQDLENLPQFLARKDDVVLVTRRPSVQFLGYLKQTGFDLPEFVELPAGSTAEKSALNARKLAALRPWAWAPDSARIFAALSEQVTAGNRTVAESFRSSTVSLYSKSWSAAFLRQVSREFADDDRPWLCAETDIGVEAGSWAAVEAAVEAIRSRGHHRVVVKAAFGVAGGSAVRLWEPTILPAQRRWIETVFSKGGTVVVEPWLDRVVDFSVQLEMSSEGLRVIGYCGLTNDHRGQFQGNWVGGDHGRRPPNQVETALRAAEAPPNWIMRFYSSLWPVLEAELDAARFRGPLGVDAFLYRGGDGVVRLKPIVEINPRYTMGRLTLELVRRVAPGVAAEFCIINRAQLRARAWSSFSELAHDCATRFPPRLAGKPKPQLREGVVFLTDPETATECVAVLLVNQHVSSSILTRCRTQAS